MRAVATAAQTTRTRTGADQQGPTAEGRAQPVAERGGRERADHAGEGGRELGPWDDDSADHEQEDPDEVRDGEHSLRAQGAGEQEGEGDEGPGPEEQEQDRIRKAADVGLPPEQEADAADDTPLEQLDTERREPLAPQQPGATQGSGPEQAEHGRPPVEAGRDRLGGEGGGDDAQREDSRGGDVDPPSVPEGRDAGERQPDQGPEGQDDGDEQLLSVAQQRAGLEAGLPAHPRGDGSGGTHPAVRRVRPK